MAIYSPRTVLALLFLLGATPLWGYAGEGAETIPTLPPVPAKIRFADEVAGRTLLFAAYDQLRGAESVHYSATQTVLVSRKAGQLASREVVQESGWAVRKADQFAITTEQGKSPNRTIRRAIANEGTLLVANYQEQGKKPTLREATRVSVDIALPLPNALATVQFSPATTAGTWLATREFPALRYGTIWQGEKIAIKGVMGSVIWERNELPDRRGQVITTQVRRYVIATESKRLLEFSQWTVRGERGKEATITYSQEVYPNWNLAPKEIPTGTFSQALPTGYVDKPVARREQLEDPILTEADPQAVALLQRWQIAQTRFLTWFATGEETRRMIPRTRESRPIPPEWQNVVVRHEVSVQRHGKTRLLTHRVSGGNTRTPRKLQFISDGQQLRVTNLDTGGSRTRPLDEPDGLWREMRRNGLEDRGALEWVYTEPPDPDDFSRIAYGGTGVSKDGEKVEILILEDLDINRRRRGGTERERTAIRVGIASDGFPRWVEQTEDSREEGALERDNPPLIQSVIHYRNLRVNSEPSATAFVLPASASKP